MAAPRSCPPDIGVGITGHSSYFLGSPNKFKDGPGGTISVSVTKASTVSATISSTAEVSVSDVIASAKLSVSGSITKSVAVTVGHTYTHNISAHKYGNAWYGSWGYKVDWEKTRDRANCTTEVLATGTAVLPVDSVGWRYWETSS
ncbi:MAG: hypothetical protein HOY79_10885 [Streptomyces sp.]|nr:hypothetical protein [Streptomyces sp.]